MEMEMERARRAIRSMERLTPTSTATEAAKDFAVVDSAVAAVVVVAVGRTSTCCGQRQRREQRQWPQLIIIH